MGIAERTLLAFTILIMALSGCVGPTAVQETEPISDVSEPSESAPLDGNAPTETSASEQVPGPVSDENASEEAMEEEDSVEREKCSRPFSPSFQAEPYYSGSLFDAHFHMPVPIDYSEMAERHGETTEGHGEMTDPILGKDITLDEILCLFDKEKVNGTIAFYITDESFLEDSLETAREIKEKSSSRIALFLMPAQFEAERLDSIQESNPGLFKGYGEIAFYFVDLKGSSPSDERFLEIYNIAEKHDLIVMMHPDLGQEKDIEEALQKNPEVKFLLHGWEISDSVAGLMEKYPNVYFSVDSAVLFPMMGLFMAGPKEKFVSRFEQDFDSILREQLAKWKGRIEKHPGRFVWGTDRGVKWHYDEEISVLFEEFARAFIARLDSSVQEKFAYQNAEKLLQEQ